MPSRHSQPRLELLESRIAPATVRTLTYDQLTSIGSGATLGATVTASEYTTMSADGSRAALSTQTSTGFQVYTIKTDGTGLTLIDSGPFGFGGGFRLSANGNVILTTHQDQAAPIELLVGPADGSLPLHDAVPVSLGVPGSSPNTLSPDGSTVFFATNTHGTWGTAQNVPGLYSMSADGTGTPQLLVSMDQVAALVGGGVTGNQINMGSTNGDDFDMALSADGTKMVFGAAGPNGSFLLGVTLSYPSPGVAVANAASLHRIGIESPFSLTSANISADGSKVVRDDTVNGLPVITVFNFDGSNGVALTNVPANFHSLGGRGDTPELTQDGSQLLLGSTSYLMNTDNSGVVQIGTNVGLDTSGPPHRDLVSSNLYHAKMDVTGTTFFYITADINGARQVGMAHLNPSSLGKAPTVNSITVSPSFVVVNNGSNYSVSAHVTSSESIAGASNAMLLGGVSEEGHFTDDRLYDDGSNGGDATAGDGVYTNNFFKYLGDGPLGPRTLRVSAETVDAAGLQHVTSVEVDPFSVVAAAPAPTVEFSTSTYTVNESAGTATITVNRAVSTSGTVTVHYATSNGTATAGTDYTATSGTLTFNDGESSKMFTIPILNSGFTGTPRTVNLTLSNPSGNNATLGTPSTATLTIKPPAGPLVITYDQLTSIGSGATSGATVTASEYTTMSADGSRAALSTQTSTGFQVYTIKTDGTGLTLIDSGPFGFGGGFRLSANGNVILTTHQDQAAPIELLVGPADGSLPLHDAVPVSLGVPGSSPNTLSPDGSTVFFATNTHGTWGTAQNVPGLYSMSADGTGTPQLLVSMDQVAALVGGGVTGNQINMGSTNGDDFDMALSADGTKMVFGAAGPNGSFLLGVTLSYPSPGVAVANAASLHRIGIESPFSLTSANISADGSKVVRDDTVNGLPVITVFNFDGSNGVALTNVPANFHSLGGRGDTPELTQDGSQLLLGSTSYLMNTDNSGVVQIGTNVGLDTSGPPHRDLVSSNLYHAKMDVTGTTFFYITADINGARQVGMAHLNPSSLGKAPTVNSITVSPSFVVVNNGSNYSVSAHVTSSESIAGASNAMLLGGVSEEGHFTDDRLYDDGSNGGDATAGDGVYTNNFFKYLGDGPLGPRTLRVSAETVDAVGLQHVTSVEVDPFSVVATSPPPPPPGLAFAVGGANGTVRLLDAAGTNIATVTPIAGYTGLVEVALGDFNSDGTPDLAVAAANPAGVAGLTTSKAGKVFVYNGVDLNGSVLALIRTFTPFATNDGPGGISGAFTNGLNIATGDVNGDGTVDLIAGTRGATGGFGTAEFGRLVVIDGTSPSGSDIIIGGIQKPFGPGYQKGVVVAAGNADGLGGDEIAVTRGGPVASTNPTIQQIKVKVFQLQGSTLAELHLNADGSTSFAPFGALSGPANAIKRDGRVAFVDTNGDGKDELVFTALDPLTNTSNERVRVGVYSINPAASTGAAAIVSTGPDAGTYLTGGAVVDHAITHAAGTGTLENLALLTESASPGVAYLDPLTGALQAGGFSLSVLHGGITFDGF